MPTASNLDPDKVWATLMSNEKPGGHGERSVAVGTIDMAVWERWRRSRASRCSGCSPSATAAKANPRVFVYAAGGYYYPGKDLSALRGEMRGYLDRGYNVVKMKIGGAPIAEDRERIEAVLKEIGKDAQLAVDANGRFDLETAIAYAKMLREYPLFWYEEAGDPLDFALQARLPNSIRRRWRPARICSATRTREISSATAACGRTATGCSSIARCPTGCANTSARWPC